MVTGYWRGFNFPRTRHAQKLGLVGRRISECVRADHTTLPDYLVMALICKLPHGYYFGIGYMDTTSVTPSLLLLLL